ncbi:MAG: MBL fold metallo-hydrolase [Saprospiraceae bacterium]|nr:MBL fold metallo-hydrolase [Saprospiraceae bacterium]
MMLKPILAGTLKLDGGAMFGVVPKKIWSKLMPPDDQNLCTWSMRCLYIEDDGKKILVDTGLGNKQDPKFLAHYEPAGDILISDALRKNGISPDEITDVILTHLHFDHVGGAVSRTADHQLQLVFKNANHWVLEAQWLNALQPNQREKASFLSENIRPLAEIIKFIDGTQNFKNIEFVRVDGHTEGMILPLIHLDQNKKILYTADLFPSTHHVHLPFIMAYDMQPLVTLMEKEKVLERVYDQNIALFFEHDVHNEVGIVNKSATGKFFVSNTMSVDEWLSKSDEII